MQAFLNNPARKKAVVDKLEASFSGLTTDQLKTVEITNLMLEAVHPLIAAQVAVPPLATNMKNHLGFPGTFASLLQAVHANTGRGLEVIKATPVGVYLASAMGPICYLILLCIWECIEDKHSLLDDRLEAALQIAAQSFLDIGLPVNPVVHLVQCLSVVPLTARDLDQSETTRFTYLISAVKAAVERSPTVAIALYIQSEALQPSALPSFWSSIVEALLNSLSDLERAKK